MAKLPGSFDSSQHSDMADFSSLPSGPYVCKLVESEMRDTKDPSNNNQYLNLKFQVMEGDFADRYIWARINVVNSNSKAADIAQKELATLCRACGKVNIDDSDELHGIPVVIKVKLKPATATRAEENQIQNYSKYDGSPVSSPSKATAATASSAKKTPW